MPSHEGWVIFFSAPLAVLSVPGAVHATQYLSVEQAQQLMFGSGVRFERGDLDLDRDLAGRIERAAGVQVRTMRQPLWRVHKNGTLVGYFIVDEVFGKHELITYALGLEPDGRVRQVEILTYRENYGFEVRNPAWRAQFAGKGLRDALQLDGDIKNISGATMSCRHITEGIRRLLATYDEALREN